MTLHQINDQLTLILTNMGIRLASLTDQAHFNRDLGLDSLDVTDMLTQVEYRFGIHIPDNDWWTLQTFGQLSAYLIAELTLTPNPTQTPLNPWFGTAQGVTSAGSLDPLTQFPF